MLQLSFKTWFCLPQTRKAENFAAGLKFQDEACGPVDCRAVRLQQCEKIFNIISFQEVFVKLQKQLFINILTIWFY